MEGVYTEASMAQVPQYRVSFHVWVIIVMGCRK